MIEKAAQDYSYILEKSNRLALATSVNQVPNVRVVNFVSETSRPGILYFTSDRGNRKVAEFAENNRIAFTTLSDEGNAHIRSCQATVQKSKLSIDEIKDLFIAKVPGYDKAIAAIGEMLDVFEIHMKEAVVVTGFKEPGVIQF